jgi:hypothetical protein
MSYNRYNPISFYKETHPTANNEFNHAKVFFKAFAWPLNKSNHTSYPE